MPPAVAILDLRCTKALGPRNAVNAFCDFAHKHDCELKLSWPRSDFYLQLRQRGKNIQVQYHLSILTRM